MSEKRRYVNLDAAPVTVKPKPRWWEVRRRVRGWYLLRRFHGSVRRLTCPHPDTQKVRDETHTQQASLGAAARWYSFPGHVLRCNRCGLEWWDGCVDSEVRAGGDTMSDRERATWCVVAVAMALFIWERL